MPDFSNLIRNAGLAIDASGVLVIVLGSLIASVLFFYQIFRPRGVSTENAYPRYRQNLGKVILLGLEFLVAGDIIRTVAIEPTYRSVGVLAIIVVIRTFLSFTLELETSGHWPWNKHSD